MADLTFHFITSRGQLSDHRDWIEPAMVQTHADAAQLLPLGALDVVVVVGKRVIPQKGHVGHAAGPGVIYITVDTESAAFCANEDRSLQRMFAHELHHAARWDGPGYGRMLGDALSSEGLAGHFAQQMFGDPIEPWEALSANMWQGHLAAAEDHWENTDYSHPGWFFGVAEMPNWLGYTLGFQIVGAYLADHPDQSAASLADAPAADFKPYLEHLKTFVS